MKTLFRAKYVVLRGSVEIPVLMPPEFAGDLPPGLVSSGNCELHTLGAGALGFTVTAAREDRRLKDSQLLDRFFA